MGDDEGGSLAVLRGKAFIWPKTSLLVYPVFLIRPDSGHAWHKKIQVPGLTLGMT
jgi:hypothetical protein